MTGTNQYYILFCSMEDYDQLCHAGWRVEQYRIVDGKEWVKARKLVSSPKELLVCLN